MTAMLSTLHKALRPAALITAAAALTAMLTGCRKEEELPEEFRNYIAFMENYLEVSIKIISLGPDREATIMR